MKLAAAWNIYANQIEAMFKKDKDIKFDFNDGVEKVITLRVSKAEKAEALEKLLPAKKEFGNITVKINVISANEAMMKNEQIDLFRKAFKGNAAVSEITTVASLWGPVSFIVFEPEVVQYHNDDMFDLNGIKTTIYQDLAKELFGKSDRIFYCTRDMEKEGLQ